MSSLATGHRIVAKAAADLKRAVDAGPDPRQLRAIAEALLDGGALLLQSAQDIELGLVD